MKSIYCYEELPAILTVKQLAEFLNIGLTQGYCLARSNQLDVLRIGNTIRIPRHSLLRYLGVEGEHISA